MIDRLDTVFRWWHTSSQSRTWLRWRRRCRCICRQCQRPGCRGRRSGRDWPRKSWRRSPAPRWWRRSLAPRWSGWRLPARLWPRWPLNCRGCSRRRWSLAGRRRWLSCMWSGSKCRLKWNACVCTLAEGESLDMCTPKEPAGLSLGSGLGSQFFEDLGLSLGLSILQISC